MTLCDHCDLPLHKDSNGYWVGPDETSDCDTSPLSGHTVEGSER